MYLVRPFATRVLHNLRDLALTAVAVWSTRPTSLMFPQHASDAIEFGVAAD